MICGKYKKKEAGRVPLVDLKTKVLPPKPPYTPLSGPKGTCETNCLPQRPKPGMKQTQGTGIVTTTVSNMYTNIPNKLSYQLTIFFLQGKYPLLRGQHLGTYRRPEQYPELYPSRTQITPNKLTYLFFLLLGIHLPKRKESKHVTEGTHPRQMIMYTEFHFLSFPSPHPGPATKNRDHTHYCRERNVNLPEVTKINPTTPSR